MIIARYNLLDLVSEPGRLRATKGQEIIKLISDPKVSTPDVPYYIKNSFLFLKFKVFDVRLRLACMAASGKTNCCDDDRKRNVNY